MIVLDFETRSHADLTKVGAWNYSLDPTTDVIVMAYLVDGGEIKTWEPGQPYPQDLRDAIYEGSTVEAPQCFVRGSDMGERSGSEVWFSRYCAGPMAGHDGRCLLSCTPIRPG